MAPRGFPSPSVGTVSVNLHSKETLQMGSKILRGGDCLGISGWTGCNHKGSYKRDTGEVRGDVMTGTEPAVMHFEGGGRGHKPRNTGGH